MRQRAGAETICGGEVSRPEASMVAKRRVVGVKWMVTLRELAARTEEQAGVGLY